MLVVLAAAGCGGADGAGDEAEVDEARQVLEELDALRPGEIVIKGSATPRVSGPYDFEPGGYTVTYEQAVAQGDAEPLVVSLEIEPGTAREPSETVVDTTQRRGTAPVDVAGQLYVNVQSGTSPFVLRFTPNDS